MVDCAEHLDLATRRCARRAAARSGSASTSTPAGGRWAAGADRRAALAGAHARAGRGAGARGRRARRAAPRRAHELRGPHRGRRRPPARQAADGRRDPGDAARCRRASWRRAARRWWRRCARWRRCASSTAAARARSSARRPRPRSPRWRRAPGLYGPTLFDAYGAFTPSPRRCSRCRSCAGPTTARRRCSAAATRPRARRAPDRLPRPVPAACGSTAGGRRRGPDPAARQAAAAAGRRPAC